MDLGRTLFYINNVSEIHLLHIISINSSDIHLLNNFGGSLESPYWLLLAFCPEILGSGGDLRMILLLFYGCHLSAVNNQRLWGHSNPIYC